MPASLQKTQMSALRNARIIVNTLGIMMDKTSRCTQECHNQHNKQRYLYEKNSRRTANAMGIIVKTLVCAFKTVKIIRNTKEVIVKTTVSAVANARITPKTTASAFENAKIMLKKIRNHCKNNGVCTQ